MRSVPFIASLCILIAASFPLRGEEPVVATGKQLAARSAIEWDVHDIDHKLLGPIRFAARKSAVTTIVGNDKILSQVFVSCQKSTGRIAIELTNAPGSDPAGGLKPTIMPRLVCSSPGPGGEAGLVRSDLSAKWEISPLGDVLTRGLSPAELRRCASIDVLQGVVPPPGSTAGSQRIAMEVTPYDRALDSVFAACGETTAYASAGEPPRAAPPVARPGSAPERSPRAQPAETPWKPARTIAKGRTNVRAAASLDSPVVTKLDPGTKVLVRRTTAPWWEVKARDGAAFRGFVRQDRLAIE